VLVHGELPAGLPRYFIEQFSAPGDVVLDPFSGRGTTALEACLAGRVGLGVDLNPLAALLTDVKVAPPAYEQTILRLAELERSYVPARWATARRPRSACSSRRP
jgi:hypothetical protein